jgi:hypothetical protein
MRAFFNSEERAFDMRKAVLVAAILAAFAAIAAGVPASAAQKSDSHEAEFRAFYAGFLSAVRSNDTEKIADMIAFPVGDMDWYVRTKDRDDAVSIKDKAEFLRKYDTFFTANTRVRVLKAKIEALESGRYAAFWDIGETRFTFLFEYIEGTGYRVESFTTGARR